MNRRNIIILMICQILCFAGASLNILIAGIVGAELAPSPAWATLPNSVTIVGLALAALPASFLMRRVGRRRGFMTGTALAAAGAFGAMLAIPQKNFPLFCLSLAGIGANMAFVQQYRFAAIENADEKSVGRALAYVLTGGMVAAILGPWLAQVAPADGSGQTYGAAYGLLLVLQLLAMGTMFFYRDGEVRIAAGKAGQAARSLTQIFRQPLAWQAVWFGAVAFATMTFVMVATPVSMHLHHGFSMQDTGFTIQSHGLAMYLPSLFTAPLLKHLDVRGMLATGLSLYLLSAGVAVVDHSFPHYWLGLVLLGLAWNLMFVGATLLVGRSHTPQERFKVQAVNDAVIFSSQALAAFAAGLVMNHWGWDTIQWICFPVLGITAALLVHRWGSLRS